MRFIILVLLFVGFISCKSERPIKPKSFSEVEIEVLLEDSLLNVRALEINNLGNFVFATSNGEIGDKHYKRRDYLNEDSTKTTLKTFNINNDSIFANFRSLALIKKDVFVLGIGSPALLYQTSDSLQLVYKETHPKAFYDSMDFWNDNEGIAIGDPTEDCMSIIITRDGGSTWNKLSCDDLPKVKGGEAAFAASDTNIAIVGDKTWVATGGETSRILFSPDKGETWKVYETPIIQGKVTTGMYSIDFYNELHGFAIGGDYTKPNDTLNNKIRTNDGGETWQVVANGKGPGYRSCVQYIPNSDAKELVAIGFKGIDYSNDAGDTWKHLSDEGFYTIRFLNDTLAYAAGNKRIAKLIFK